MLPRPRFSVRWLMLVVAIIGLVMSLVAYRGRLQGRAAYHRAQMAEHGTPIPTAPSLPPGILVARDPETGTMTAYRMTPQAQWHARMASEYTGSAARLGVLITAMPILSGVLAIVIPFRRWKSQQSEGR